MKSGSKAQGSSCGLRVRAVRLGEAQRTASSSAFQLLLFEAGSRKQTWKEEN